MSQEEDDGLVDSAAVEEENAEEDNESVESGQKDSSEEEEGEENNEYDYTDNFLAREDEDDDEDGEGEGDEGVRRRRHKRRRERDKSPELDEEDYELLEENQVTGIRRKPKSERKRIRKQQDRTDKSAADRLKDELFGTGEDGLEDDLADEVRPSRQSPVDDEVFDASDDDDMAGFIDDDVGSEGQRRQRRAKPKGLPKGVSSQAMLEAQDIFGDVDALLEMYAEKKAAAVVSHGDEDEEDLLGVPEDEEDEEAMAAYQGRMEASRQQRQKKKIESQVEPQLMERLMMLPIDDRIRELDVPERFQLSGEADLKESLAPEDYQAAATWIQAHLVGDKSRPRLERDLLEAGCIEVDGKPRDGKQRMRPNEYDDGELVQGITDLSKGLRAIRKTRTREEIKGWKQDEGSKLALRDAIQSVLEEMYDKQHELPFIASYRKEICQDLLCQRASDLPDLTNWEDVKYRRAEGLPNMPLGSVQAKHRKIRRWDILWAVHSWAGRWRAFARRRDARVQAYHQALNQCAAEPQEEPEAENLVTAIQGCITAMKDAETMTDIDDIDLKYKLLVSGSVLDSASLDEQGIGLRRAHRSSAYSILQKLGVEPIVRKIAMSADRFGANLEVGYKTSEPEEPKMMPEDMAYDFLEERSMGTPDLVLGKARQMAALEVASEPRVRAYVRQVLHKSLRVSTAPTVSGDVQLDGFHLYGQVRQLEKKPVEKFEDTDQFLRIHLASKDGLLTYSVEVENMEQTFVEPMRELYVSSDVSAVSKRWNEQREAILRDAVEQLVPQLQAEAIAQLLVDAREVALQQCRDTLWQYASAAPLQMKMPDTDELVERRRFMACCWGEGRPATAAVMLDEQGALQDVLYCSQLSGPLRPPGRNADSYKIFQDPRKAKDAGRLKDFIVEHRPHAILVGGSNLFCKVLKEDLGRIYDYIIDVMPQVMTRHDTGNIDIRYAEITLADLWADSAAAREEFPDHPDIVRKAVALGRLSLEPLAVLASLMRHDSKEILALNLHPLQAALPEADLARAAEITLITAVNQVGVDINVMAHHPWQAAQLQFVAGLGPRKAKALVEAVQKREYVTSRFALWQDFRFLGNCVFRNCGGFLRISTIARGMSNADVDPMDSMRIHPRHYKDAVRMAQAAQGDTPPEQADEAEEHLTVNKALQHPEKIEALDLEALNEEIMRERDTPDQISLLIDIAMEYAQPFGELRHDPRKGGPPMEDDAFWWLTGEKESTLKPGRRVEALVRFVGKREVRCILPEIGGLEAVLDQMDISSSGLVNPDDLVHANQNLTARIKEVRSANWEVQLTTTSRDLNDEATWEEKYSKGNDAYYRVLTSEERSAKQAKLRKAAAKNKPLTQRGIKHPNFQNSTQAEATTRAQHAEVGEAIFRPSPRGVGKICLTMKIYDGPEGSLVVHKDVVEGAKRGALGLGTPLKLTTDGNKREEEYEDLDEIIARFVDPYAAMCQQVTDHRKFRNGQWEDVKAQLRHEAMHAARGQATYCLAISFEKPGFFYLAYVLPTMHGTPHREYFHVSPNGIYFRQKVHKSVEHVIGAFKKQPIQQSAERMGYAAPLIAAPTQPNSYAPQIYSSYREPHAATGTGVAGGPGQAPTSVTGAWNYDSNGFPLPQAVPSQPQDSRQDGYGTSQAEYMIQNPWEATQLAPPPPPSGPPPQPHTVR